VRVKIEMPGTEDGVDVYPGTVHPIEFPKHASFGGDALSLR